MSDDPTTPAATAAGSSTTGYAEPRQKGHLRFDRRFGALGVPRLQKSSETHDPGEFSRRNDALTALAQDGERGGPILRAFAKGALKPLDKALDDVLRAAHDARFRALLANEAKNLLDAKEAEAAAASSPAGGASPLMAAHERAPTPTLAPAQEPSDIIAHIRGPRPRDVELVALPLWTTLVAVIEGMNLKAETKRRYTTSVRALRRKANAFAMPDELHEELAGISEAEWDAIDAFRRHGLTVQ